MFLNRIALLVGCGVLGASGGWGSLGQGSRPVLAQSITPATDGTGTIVTPNGNQWNISGGTSTQGNLFHSFGQFNVNSGDIANFLADPSIQNILGRVSGGDASVINGLIQVSGSGANLYLMNPAGMILGPGAQLNVGGSFIATTASALGWTGALWPGDGSGDYAALVGSPNQFLFTGGEGAIVNGGHLAVPPGQDLALVGNSVVNTGSVTALGGEVLLLSVPTAQTVTLRQPGMLLSLDLGPTVANLTQPLHALDLPGLLTHSPIGNATGLTLNPDGTVSLTGSGLALSPTAGLTLVAGSIDTNGTICGSIAALGTQVALLGADLDASGALGGGQILVGGDYKGGGSVPTAQQTLVDPQAVLRVSATEAGHGGRAIVWADDSTRFFGTIAAQGGPQGGNGGFVEVSGKNYLTFQGQVNTAAPQGLQGQLLLDPSFLRIIDSAATTGDFDAFFTGHAFTINSSDADLGSNTIFWGSIVTATSAVTLEATGDITIANISSDLITVPQALTLRSTQGSIVAEDPNDTISVGSGDDLTLTAAQNVTVGNLLTFSSSPTAPGDIVVTATSGDLTVGEISISQKSSGSGTVTLTAPSGNITFQTIDTSYKGTGSSAGGDVTISTNQGVVRGLGTLSSASTINTSSTFGTPGTINITHGGGPSNFDFVVGDSSLNGTAGEIVTDPGDPIVSGTTFAMAASGSTKTPRPEISITNINSAPSLSPTTINIGVSNSPITFTLAGLSVSDADGDTTTLEITAILQGSLTTAAGVALGVGDFISTTETLIYTPPDGTTGSGLSAFRVQAVDEHNGSPSLSTSSTSLAVYDVAATTITTTNTTETDTNFDPTCDLESCEPEPDPIGSALTLENACNSYDSGLAALDNRFASRFEQYFGLTASSGASSLASACQMLASAAGRGETPGVIYVTFSPGIGGSMASVPVWEQWTMPPLEGWADALGADFSGLAPFNSLWSGSKQLDTTADPAKAAEPAPGSTSEATAEPATFTPQPTDQLELMLLTPDRAPVFYRSNITRSQVTAMGQQLRREVSDPSNLLNKRYLAPAQRLHTWLIKPLAETLEAEEVRNLVFVLDDGIRTLPLAALHDGEDFIVEHYSVGLIPSLRLTESIHVDLQPGSQQVLAMGASLFTDQDQTPLPAVPLELSLISQELWRGPQPLLNEEFTQNHLEQGLKSDFGILHLATHAAIQPGDPSNSYLQLIDRRLPLPELRQLLLNSPSVRDLMVLSACRTALESEEAELGFAGLAFGAGVNTALASLWNVSDLGTLALMGGFYGSLGQPNPETDNPRIKADALRSAQLAMIHGQVNIDNDRLTIPGVSQGIPLPPDVSHGDNEDLSHPYFWSAFTLVGNPW
ncbi:CHAT domain-containing protein [Prochlorothrix hollandica]|uniref:Filamentous haemagglutinin FhaB/tRNA nuclease CdiA-like TPS domain-containing protein n=1 Tax=Prochlorothrix hollandica PCC 9006 = CALU 1027 TaxID=317619 RepID=A0A0M2PYZ3_PROHO|nr:CHAT domain-containing protein [Prochlorothrix hollandica]KKJ01360.1 hypothetical protein PROH_03145 [Prochlorothrix hollandica PCC 9006 = CALU 1027]